LAGEDGTEFVFAGRKKEKEKEEEEEEKEEKEKGDEVEGGISIFILMFLDL
jgi:hypothetical protein